MSDEPGLLKRRIDSIVFAGRGVVVFFRTQFHAWVHLLATVVVVAAGLWFPVSAGEWALLALAIGLVWTAEALNSAVEFTVDLASPEYHDVAGKAKDVAAAAVLLAALTAVAVACCVFGPRIHQLFS